MTPSLIGLEQVLWFCADRVNHRGTDTLPHPGEGLFNIVAACLVCLSQFGRSYMHISPLRVGSTATGLDPSPLSQSVQAALVEAAAPQELGWGESRQYLHRQLAVEPLQKPSGGNCLENALDQHMSGDTTLVWAWPATVHLARLGL